MRSIHHYNRGLVLRLLVCGCLLLLMAACTARPPAHRPAAATKDEPYDFTAEGNIPPLKDAEVIREADFEEVPVLEEEVLGEDVDISPEESVAGVHEAAVVQVPGFRVQVFATGSQETAEAVREAAELKLGLPVYSEIVEGLYKVRIGDCASREEAEALLQRCQAAGYGDAWIVETMVKASVAP
jgi:hypothetical protein